MTLNASYLFDFSECSLSNDLWPNLVDRITSEKACRAINQAIDLQNIYGNDFTLPLLIVETCGSAIVDTKLLKEQIGIALPGKGVVILYSSKNKLIQFLKDYRK